jgi:hypothetical protein
MPQLLYNPFLRETFASSYRAQVEEFMRLFEKLPSHIDGHHHMHLCANLLLSKSIPAGMRLGRNFSFWPGEKGFLKEPTVARSIAGLLVDTVLRTIFST